MQSRWLSQTQAAEYLHTTSAGIDGLVEQGHIRRYKGPDGAYLFDVHDLDQYVLTQRHDRPVDPMEPATAGEPVTPPPGGDRVAVRRECPRQEVQQLIAELKQESHGTMLTRELEHSLEQSDYRSLPGKVAQRLARWCSPRREDDRTRFVTPIARKISKLLFGDVLPRSD